MVWKTILVPHDFSSCANHAAALARDVAQVHGARLVLLHVTEMPLGLGPETVIVPDEGGAPIKVRDYALRSAQDHLDDLAARLRKEQIDVTTIAVMGHIIDEILETAGEEKADLIVMGTHGRTGLSHLVAGSIAEKIVRNAPVPVLTVRVPDDKKR
jgi:universal stress protein A